MLWHGAAGQRFAGQAHGDFIFITLDPNAGTPGHGDTFTGYNAKTGAVDWTLDAHALPADTQFTGAVVTSGDHIYALALKGNSTDPYQDVTQNTLIAFQAGSSTPQWITPITPPKEITGYLMGVHDGKVLLQDGVQPSLAYDQTTGAAAGTSPAPAADNVIDGLFTDAEHQLRDPASGQAITSYQHPCAWNAKVVVTGNQDNLGDLAVLDRASHSQLWSDPAPAVCMAATDNNEVIVGDRTNLLAFDATTGTQKWTVPAPGDEPAADSVPFVGGGIMLVASDQDYFVLG